MSLRWEHDDADSLRSLSFSMLALSNIRFNVIQRSIVSLPSFIFRLHLFQLTSLTEFFSLLSFLPTSLAILPFVRRQIELKPMYRRRAKAREQYKQTGVKADHTANFFDNDNASAAKAREGLAEECLENLIRWLKEEGGNVGIHDATNSTIARRKKLYDRVSKEPGLKIVFLESVCTDPAIISANIEVKVASGDPDYDGVDKSIAERDFRARIKTYEDNYEELGITQKESKLSYCKIIDVGKQVIVNRIDGYLESRVAFCESIFSPFSLLLSFFSPSHWKEASVLVNMLGSTS